MRKLIGIILFICANTTPGFAENPYQAVIDRSLGYFAGDSRHFSITDPWTPLSGGQMVCVRPDVPDGSGGFAPTTDYSMYSIESGRITSVIKDNSLFGCPNRTYYPLNPIKP